ncbi:NAD(P)/FAD-dependent oxidoreductase [Arsenicitalea aurantiaca]|nr:FAD-binding oxidoreductase [Arsenicitalea aurantiaca]
MADVIVLGAGIVGICTAINLQRRGRQVVLVDRKTPGRETSYGNAGLIQKEGVRPYAFPREFGTLLRIAQNTSIDARYSPTALPALAPLIMQYWYNSAPERYRQIVADYAPLILSSVDTHAELIAEAGAEDLVSKDGWYRVFRSAKARDIAFAQAEDDERRYGVTNRRIDGPEMARIEPDVMIPMSGAIHWVEPWGIKDPGSLADAYVALFRKLGGVVATGDAMSLATAGKGWRVTTDAGPVEAGEAVITLGPWSRGLTRQLGYRLPLFVKRGYHMHYGTQDNKPLRHWLLDSETGYLLAPMLKGIRLTTGAEFAPLDTPGNPVQLEAAERVARQFFPLGERREPQPWMGSRPCTPDMKPVIGRAPKHGNLWFGFGHAHHGLTLGAATGKLLGQAMTGEKPYLDLAPFSAARFGS